MPWCPPLHLPKGAGASCQQAPGPSRCPMRYPCSRAPRSALCTSEACQPHPRAVHAGPPPPSQTSSRPRGQPQPGAAAGTQVSSLVPLSGVVLMGSWTDCLSAFPAPCTWRGGIRPGDVSFLGQTFPEKEVVNSSVQKTSLNCDLFTLRSWSRSDRLGHTRRPSASRADDQPPWRRPFPSLA